MAKRKAQSIDLDPPNHQFWVLGGIERLCVGVPGRVGRRMITSLSYVEGQSRSYLSAGTPAIVPGRSWFSRERGEHEPDGDFTVVDPVRLQQLCDSDPRFQELLAEAARGGLRPRAVARVEKHLARLFLRLLAETQEHLVAIQSELAHALIARQANRGERGRRDVH